uniref:Uncharacterized protein n=1 Tax=Avena sativa TaxID=4498 RepID=A0ACD5Y4U0_AVESA
MVVNPVSSTKNCGLVVVEGGEISSEELAEEFSKIYKTNWPWQIRELGQPDIYLVKFPPHIQVEQVIGYPRFGLSKEGVWVKVETWCDDPEPVELLQDIWVRVTGLQAKWCERNVLDQALSVCGILQEIDWLSIFKNNAKEVRAKIKCRDPMKIPGSRLFHFHGGLF